MLFQTAGALSPPVAVDLPFTVMPTRVDSDGKNLLAFSFSNRKVLGLYYVNTGSYVEVDLESPVLMTTFSRQAVVALLATKDRLALVDVSTRKIEYRQLESEASAVVAENDELYVVYPTIRRIDRVDLRFEVFESFDYSPAEGTDQFDVFGKNIYIISRDLNEVTVLGEKPAVVKLDGVAVLVKAVADGAWVVLSDDTVLKISGSSVIFKTTLPRATFVYAATTIDNKLVYASVTRRVIGIVDGNGFREIKLPDNSPFSVAATEGRRIWFLDGVGQKLFSLYDSVSPRLSNWRVETLPDGSALVRVMASDPDNDLASVMLVPVEYQGIYQFTAEPIPMSEKQGFFEAIYRPGTGITKVELYVNGTDIAGNSVSERVGEIDYSKSQTSPQVTTFATAVPSNPATAPALVSELLLLIPLIIVVSVLIFARRPRRKRPKKR